MGDFVDSLAAPFRVFVDGTEVGELWANQIKYFGVTPGTHVVQLRQYVIGFNKVELSVADGEVVELACWRAQWSLLSKLHFGPYRYLHLATESERQRMDLLAAKLTPPTPRNLGAN